MTVAEIDASMTIKLELCLLLVLFVQNCFTTLANGNVPALHQNATVMINQTAYFACTVPPASGDVHWRKNSDTNFIYAGREIVGSFKERFSVNISSGVSILTISSVKPEDAGRYICEDSGFGKDQFSAVLIVVEGHPSCSSNKRTDGFIGPNSCGIPPDVVELSCSVRFYGDVPPRMSWKRTGDIVPVDGNTSIVTSGNRTTNSLRFEANIAFDNSTYFCETQFSGHQLHCQSGIVNVTNIQSNRHTLNRSVGDEVPCSGHAGKNCTYSWQSLQSDSNVSVFPSSGGKQMNLKINDPGIYICEEVCIIRGVPCATITMVVYVSESKDKSKLSFLLMILIALVVTSAIILTVWLVKNKERVTQCFANGHAGNNPVGIGEVSKVEDGLLGWNSQKKSADLQGNMGNENNLSQIKAAADEPLLQTPARECHEADGTNGGYQGEDATTRNRSEPIKTIKTETAEVKNTPIYGMAILADELFIATGWSSTIEVWKLKELTRSRKFEITALIRPFDLVSCTSNQCLYIFDYKGEAVKSKEIIRVNECGLIIKQWGIGNDVCQGLSVTYDKNVIFSTFEEDVPHILEYDPEGVLLRSIKVSPDIQLTRILHVIKVEDHQFLISHGSKKYKNVLHRVCVAKSKRINDSEGVLDCVEEFFGGQHGLSKTQLNVPMHLAIKGDGTVLVADRENSRVLLLSWPSVTLIREQIPKTSNILRTAYKLCLDETRGHLFVADNARLPTEQMWGNGRILVFEMK